MGRDAVRQVDDPHVGRDPRDHEVADPDELVAQAEIRDEHDGTRQAPTPLLPVHRSAPSAAAFAVPLA